MLRKLVMVVVLLAVIAAAAFWFVTMPATAERVWAAIAEGKRVHTL